MAGRKKKEPNAELLKTVAEAKAAGMSYGQYQAKKFIEEEMARKEELKQKKQAEHIETACREAGLGGHVMNFGKNHFKASTEAQKIMMEQFASGKVVPAKTSFMYCDELDMCFFYSASGKACCSYSGITKAGSDDIEHNIVQAFKSAKAVLDRMQELYIKDRP